MKFHCQTSIYALVALVSPTCVIRAAETGATTRNIDERYLSSKQHHGHATSESASAWCRQTLTVDFDEITTGDAFGWYTNEHIQMENFRYGRNAPAYVVKSPPNAAYHF